MNKQNVVKVIANQNGEVLSVSPNNPEYGWLAVESLQPTFQGSFMRLNKRVAFVAGTVAQLEQYVSSLQIVEGSELPGKIVIREQLEALNADNDQIGIKYPNAAAKLAGLACTVDDQPVYRKSFYTPDVTQQDVLVQHTNSADIKAFMDEQKALAAAPVAPAPKANTRPTAGAKK